MFIYTPVRGTLEKSLADSVSFSSIEELAEIVQVDRYGLTTKPYAFDKRINRQRFMIQHAGVKHPLGMFHMADEGMDKAYREIVMKDIPS